MAMAAPYSHLDLIEVWEPGKYWTAGTPHWIAKSWRRAEVAFCSMKRIVLCALVASMLSSPLGGEVFVGGEILGKLLFMRRFTSSTRD